MKIFKTFLSLLLVSLTPLISFLTFEQVGYSYIYYNYNGVYDNVNQRIKVGDLINLQLPFDVIGIDGGAGYSHSFEGWYLNENLTTPFDYETMTQKNLSVYAKWNLFNSWSGNSFQTPIMMSVNQYHPISVTYTGGQYFILKFIPANSRQYHFRSISNGSNSNFENTKAFLYDGDSRLTHIAYNAMGGPGGNFQIYYSLISGRNYYIKVSYVSIYQIGSFYVSVN
jgi:uncharacterized repeat protein (TIGR02543 family)